MVKIKNIPIISVIIPTYNRAHLIEKTLKSTLNQSYQSFEIIIIDDGSTDNTREVLGRINDERIRCFYHEENKGTAAARNTGIKNARGEYIAFLDDDVEWLPEKLEKQIEIFKTDLPELGVVYSDSQLVINNKMKYWKSPEVTRGILINPGTSDYQAMNIGTPTMLVKKECFEKVGLFDERFFRFIDLELLLRLSKHYHFYHIKEPLIRFYSNDGLSSDINALIKARKLLLERYFEKAKKNKKFLAKQYFSIGANLCLIGKVKEGRKHLIKSVKLNPLNIKFFVTIVISLFGSFIFNKVAKTFRGVRPKHIL